MRICFALSICLAVVGVALGQVNGSPTEKASHSAEAIAVQVNWDALPDNPQPVDSKPGHEDQADKTIFGMLANNHTVGANEPFNPISAGHKLKLAVDYLSPFTVAFVAVSAAFDQALDFKAGYGQGVDGYGKRYGADFTTGLTHVFFVTGAFPALLHEDPRYFRKGQGSAGSRFAYAISRVAVTRRDSGTSGFNCSEVLGSAASAGIADRYYPERDRGGFGGFAIRMGLQIAVESGFNVLREYYPDISRKIFKKR